MDEFVDPTVRAAPNGACRHTATLGLDEREHPALVSSDAIEKRVST